MSQGKFGGLFDEPMRKPLRDISMLRNISEVTWTAPDLASLPSWQDAKDVSIDVETCDPTVRELGPGVRRDGFMAGIGFAIEDGPSYYLPFAHEGGGNLDKEKVLQYFKDQTKVFTGTIVGANLGYDFDFLWHAGINFTKAKIWRDVLVADPLINELHWEYDLTSVANRWDLPGKAEGQLEEHARAYGIHAKKDLWRLPAGVVGPYAEQDVWLPHKIRRRQEAHIDRVGLWDVYNLECELTPVLLKMRQRGVRVNMNKVANIENWTLQVEAECWQKVKDLTGVQIKVGDASKTDVLARALVAYGVNPPKTPTGKPSVKNGWLRTVKNELTEAMIRAREFSKLRTTFCKQIRDFAIWNGHEHRIHSTFNQVKRSKSEEGGGGDDDEGDSEGARFGRCSSTKPNFQYQPTRNEEFGDIWRDIYEADGGAEGDMEWVCADLSQQEPRILIHYAELCNLPRAKEAGDRYRNNPETDNHQMLTDWILELGALTEYKKPRTIVKNIYNGLSYGMGGAKLCRSIGKPTAWKEIRGVMVEIAGAEGQQILDLFHRVAPYVKALSKLTERAAQEKGYIRAGIRHCHFPKKPGGGYDWTHKALNRLVQGEAANQAKKAMVDADKAGIPLQSTVHDELNYSERRGNRKRAFELKHLMETGMKFLVPSLVNLEIGPTWGTVEKVA